jgi:hypothetical protein
VRDRLGLYRRRAISKPFLTPRARKLRLAYAIEHRENTVSDWKRTIFVDEAIVRVDGNGVVWVTRAKREAYLEENMRARMKGQVGGLMLFAGIWHGGRTEMVLFNTNESAGKRQGVTAIIYCDQITKGPLKAAWNRVNNRWRGYEGARLLEDNVGIHRSQINRAQGARQGFVYMDHPPYSPDLYPIENIWSLLKRRLAQLPRKPTNKDELFTVLQRLWGRLVRTGLTHVWIACLDDWRQ